MKRLRAHFEISKGQQKGILVLLLLLTGIYLGLYAFKNPPKEGPKPAETDQVALLKLQKQLDQAKKNSSSSQKKPSKDLSPFDPNQLNLKGWTKLGFIEKQARVIIKYRNSLGGFSSKEQIKKCFVISEKKFEQIAPYIRLEAKPTTSLPTPQIPVKTSPKYKAFDPNQLGQKDWEALGFSPKQAMVILKYKKSLGGFSSLEQIRKCFVINDEKFRQLKPYIQLYPPPSIQNPPNPSASPTKKDLNSADWEALLKYAGEKRLVRRIINYRNALSGFVSTAQLKEVYGLPEAHIEAITTDFEITDPKSVQKISLNQATTKRLKKHPYLRAYAEKIIAHKEKNGPFKQLEDLKEIEGISEENFQRIRLYLVP